MTTQYRNQTELCKAHRTPSLNYTHQDIVDIIDQYHVLIHKQWHSQYKRRNQNYERILDLIASQFAGIGSFDTYQLSKSLKYSIKYIKDTIIAHINDTNPGYDLAPHIVMRTYNLFVSLDKSLDIYMRRAI